MSIFGCHAFNHGSHKDWYETCTQGSSYGWSDWFKVWWARNISREKQGQMKKETIKNIFSFKCQQESSIIACGCSFLVAKKLNLTNTCTEVIRVTPQWSQVWWTIVGCLSDHKEYSTWWTEYFCQQDKKSAKNHSVSSSNLLSSQSLYVVHFYFIHFVYSCCDCHGDHYPLFIKIPKIVYPTLFTCPYPIQDKHCNLRICHLQWVWAKRFL